MSIKDRLRRLETRLDNIYSGLELTDADLGRLENRVDALAYEYRRLTADHVGNDALRSSIASVIYRELEYDGNDFCGHVADVLIRELSLSETAGVIVGCNHEDNDE